MKLISPAYGELEYSESDVIRFPEGLIGFPASHRFLLLDSPETSPFRPLQSVDDPYLVFITTDPRLIVKNYSISITIEDMKGLGVDKSEDLAIFAICILPENYVDATANLRAPVLVNHQRMIGRQVILAENTAFSHHHNILQAPAQ